MTEIRKALFAALACRVVFVILVILTLPIRPTLPVWMLEWFRRIAYPLLAYSIVSLVFHKKAAALLQKHAVLLAVDLAISVGIISIGGSWRSSYFGYTFTSIILFTLFKGRWGAYGSALVLSAAAVIKDPAGGLPSLQVFFVSDWDMRMGAALIYITAGAILGYFYTLLQRLEALSKAKIEETQKRAAMEEKTRMALELHDGAKQMVNAMILKMNPLVKKIQSSQDEMSDELRWLWRGMNYLKSEFNQVMDMLRQENPEAGAPYDIVCLIEEEAKIAEVMTGFSWKVMTESHGLDLHVRSQLPLRRFLSEALMNAWKHSGAAGGVITIGLSGGSAVITVADNGKGFVHADNPDTKTTGLRSLHYRAKEMHGNLVINTAPDRGCRLILTIPTSQIATSLHRAVLLSQ